MTYSDIYFRQIDAAIEFATETGSFDKRNIIDSEKNVCVFGLGTYFNEAFTQQSVKKRFHVNLLCDNDPAKWGRIINGLRCISPSELGNYDDIVVITMLGDPRQVGKQLDSMGITHITHDDLSLDSINDLSRNRDDFKQQTTKIRRAYHLLLDDQSRQLFANILCLRIAPKFANFSYEELYSDGEYFGHDCFQVNSMESYVDCGAFNGDTLLKFLDVSKGSFDHAYAFELDANNYRQLVNNISCLDPLISRKIDCFNLGVWNEDREIQYGRGVENEPSEGISLFKKNRAVTARVVQLDHALAGSKVTLIKMDIEGAEQDALMGASDILSNQRPKLAICLYHRLDDLWEIPLFLKSLVPEYRIQIRHHYYFNVWGTVCYATV